MVHTDCPNQPKLDPRVRRTRKLIEDAFRALLRERPFGEISVGDVAERATVNRATFYAHFEDKRHLMTTMMGEDLHDALLARLAPGSSLTSDTLTELGAAVFEFVDATFRACPKHGDELSATLATTLQGSIESFLGTWLSRDPAARRAFPGSSPETVATTLAWAFYGGALRWTRLTRRPPAAESAREIVALLVR